MKGDINRDREGECVKVEDVFKAREKCSFKQLSEAGCLYSANRARPRSPRVNTDRQTNITKST